MSSNKPEWSERRKWCMGLVEKLVVGLAAGLVSLFWIDRYELAKDERRARQEALANRQESLSNSSLAYASALYDAYHTPCGKAGHARVRYLQDEAFFAFTNAIDAIQRSCGMFKDPQLATETHRSADAVASKAQKLYDKYLLPILSCGCNETDRDIDDRLEPKRACTVDPAALDTKAFDVAYRELKDERAKLLESVAKEYQVESSRSMLTFLWKLM